MSLDNKVIILTGCSTGIGAFTAQYLAQYNPRLVLVARRSELLEQIFVLPADLSNVDELKRIVSETIGKFGQIDVLVNNAVSSAAMGGVGAYTTQDFDNVMTVNLRAPIFLCQEVVPYLKKTKGSIVNVSSGASTMPMPEFTLYATGMAALDQFSRCLALELAPFDVRVNTVRPGFIMTERFDDMPPYVAEQMRSQAKSSQPLKGAGEPIDVAKVIKFLASEDSSFMTGDCVYADGGGHLTSAHLKSSLNKSPLYIL